MSTLQPNIAAGKGQEVIRIPKSIFYVAVLNIAILAGIGLFRLAFPQLAYELGSIYAGVLVGISFTFLAQSMVRSLPNSSFEAFHMVSQSDRRFFVLRGTKRELISIVGMGTLLGLLVIIGDNTFFSHRFATNLSATVIIMAIVGSLYAMVLLGIGVWFDYWIWRGGLFDYVIAIFSILFILSIVGSFSYYFLRTSFFVVGIVTRAISSLMLQRQANAISENIRLKFYMSVPFILFLPIIFKF